MNKKEKTIKLLEAFLSDKEVDGVCGYTVIPDYGEDSIQVIVILDIDYIKKANTKPGFIAKMIREGVKQEIKKWIGLDVYVGSTAKKCNESESMTESKKKYIVTESQMKLLLENDTMLWIKRRATKNFMFDFIQKAEIEFPTLCDDFENELDYASNVIRWAIDDFLTIDEEMFLDDRYDEVSDILTELCKDWFGDYLIEIYRNTCTEEDGY
jgi:hypothetical protein